MKNFFSTQFILLAFIDVCLYVCFCVKCFVMSNFLRISRLLRVQDFYICLNEVDLQYFEKKKTVASLRAHDGYTVRSLRIRL